MTKIIHWLTHIKIDQFLLLLISIVTIASFFPCYGDGKLFFDRLSVFAIALLFFMHGAKLSVSTMFQALLHWRLHLTIFAITFILFPLFGVVIQFLPLSFLPKDVMIGILFLCTLPATVQSSIAFTSMAKGNVPAAICSASASTILGVFITPMLITFLIDEDKGNSMPLLDSIESIVLKLVVPFFAGMIARVIIGKWVDRHKSMINKVDRSSILIVVYVAFSEAVTNHIWAQIDLLSLLFIVILSLILLLLVIFLTTQIAHWLKFNKEDEITLVFCGSKKSLASGIPMASLLFSASSVGIILLPLMIFHQIQLMVCSVLAAKYAKRK